MSLFTTQHGGRLLVFAKAPIPGQVKTRLMPPLSANEAAALHRELVEKTLRAAAGCLRIAAVELWCAPVVDDPFFQDWAQRYGINLRAQHGVDLGARMHHALLTTLEQGAEFALVAGTDCPSLTADYLDSAAATLAEGADIVLAPAEDGGYALIGLRCAHPYLFTEIDWGTDTVLQTTRDRIRTLGLSARELSVVWDVDRPRDLARYRRLANRQ